MHCMIPIERDHIQMQSSEQCLAILEQQKKKKKKLYMPKLVKCREREGGREFLIAFWHRYVCTYIPVYLDRGALDCLWRRV